MNKPDDEFMDAKVFRYKSTFERISTYIPGKVELSLKMLVDADGVPAVDARVPRGEI